MSKIWQLVRKIFGSSSSSGKTVQSAAEQTENYLHAFDCIQKERVREELGLNHDQIGLIGMHTREVRQKHRSSISKLQTLPEDKRRGERRKLRTIISGEVMRAIYEAGILTEEQRTRFQQILWQQKGARAFVDPALCDALQLRLPQKEAILNILEKTRKKVGALSHGGSSMEENRPETESLRGEAMEKSLEVLSEEQRQRWETLKGAPFVVGRGGADSSASEDV